MSEIDDFLNSVLRKGQATELDMLIEFEAFSGRAEGRSQSTINLTVTALTKLKKFLSSNGLTTDAKMIDSGDLRYFILSLQSSKRFTGHPYTKIQDNELSAISVNSYLRAIRAAFNRWVAEGFIHDTPFEKVKVPKAPKKVIPTFSQEQISALLNVIDTSTAVGFRDHLLILLYLDTGCRLSEITNLRISDVNIREGYLRVLGKGHKERVVPIGITTGKLLWKYLQLYRPE